MLIYFNIALSIEQRSQYQVVGNQEASVDEEGGNLHIGNKRSSENEQFGRGKRSRTVAGAYTLPPPRPPKR